MATIGRGAETWANTWLLDSPPPLEDLSSVQAVYAVEEPSPDMPDKELQDVLRGCETNGLLVTSAHEVWPGHFMQYVTTLAQQHKQSKARLLDFTVPGNATCEGWAHYVEQMVVEEGLGPVLVAQKWGDDAEDYLRFGQLSNALLRVGRLIIMLHMHYTKEYTTRADAANYMREKCLQTETLATSEALRATYDTPMMNYTFGKMMILNHPVRADPEVTRRL
jgi:uncharacterized protein (DUF885 family)